TCVCSLSSPPPVHGDAYTALSALSIDASAEDASPRRRPGPNFLPLHLRAKPIEDLPTGPVQHTWLGKHVAIKLLQVSDAMRHSRNIRMNTDRHHPARHQALLVETIEVISTAAQHLLGRMMLDDHHHDVVDLDGIGHREHRTVRGRDVDRLVV